jgi:tetratricopeptide (TPR) repeat protein
MRKVWEVITAVITVVAIVLVCVLGWQVLDSLKIGNKVLQNLESKEQVIIVPVNYDSNDIAKDIATAQLQLQKDYYDSRIKILEMIFTFLGIIIGLLVVFLGFQIQSIRKESNELLEKQEKKFDKQEEKFEGYEKEFKGYESRLEFLSARVLADSSYSDNDYEEALVQYQKVIAQKKDLKNDVELYTLVHRRVGWCAYCLGDQNKAIEYHKEGLKILSTDKQTLCSLGYIYLDDGKLDEAKEYFDKALKGEGNAPYLYANYAQLYLKKAENALKDDDQKAVEYYEEAIKNLVDHYNDKRNDQKYKDYLKGKRKDFDEVTVKIMRETIERKDTLDPNDIKKVYDAVKMLEDVYPASEGADQVGYAYYLWNQKFDLNYKFDYEGEDLLYNIVSTIEPTLDHIK